MAQRKAAEGFRTVVRPHPAFFESVYPEGDRLMRSLEKTFAKTPKVVFEGSINLARVPLVVHPEMAERATRHRCFLW